LTSPSWNRWERGWAYALRRFGADVADPLPGTERWPNGRQGFLWDLAPARIVPGRDGLVPPDVTVPAWIAAAPDADLDDLISIQRMRADSAHAAAATTEGKASRLLTPTIVLLAGMVTLSTFELRASAKAGHILPRVLLAIGVVPAVVAVIYLLVCAVRALDTDTRVGLYGNVTGHRRASGGRRAHLEEQHRAAVLAEWTSKKKASRLMDARAAFSRALVAVALALAIGAVTTAIYA
jgi:hypothetical protein